MFGIKWNKPEDWPEDAQAFPNEECLLLVEVTDLCHNCLVDQEQGTHYCTMGHWMPQVPDSKHPEDQGHWEYVGWDWCQDHFTPGTGDKVVGWIMMPDVQAAHDVNPHRRGGGKGFMMLSGE